MEEISEEVLFEAWFYKLKHGDSQSRLRFSSSWIKRYFMLRRIGDKAHLQYYQARPVTSDEHPKSKYELWPAYKIEKRYNMKGKQYVLQITTSMKTLIIATEDESLFHLFAFFLQTQTQLVEIDNNPNSFVVRPENSEEHKCLGARGSMCILQITEWGIILAFELSRCVLALWPLKSIKSYEMTGKGQFGLEIGKNSTTGPGMFVFNTRMAQDTAIYNVLDNYINQAVQLRQHSSESLSDLTMAGELRKLQQFTVAKSDSRFTAQLKKISRNIHDPLLQLIGGESQRRQVSSSSSDVLADATPSTQRNNSTRSQGVSLSETPPSGLPPKFDREAHNARLHRTPPPTYHRYSNEEAFKDRKEPELKLVDQYMTMQDGGDPQLGFSPAPLLSQSPIGFQTFPKSASWSQRSQPVGVTAVLPVNYEIKAVTSWPRLQRLASRSAEDLHANNFYDNGTFQNEEGHYPQDRDETGHIIYSYAMPGEVHDQASQHPKDLIRQRSTDAKYSPLMKARVRRSMSNPNILGSQLDQIIPPQDDDSVGPELPSRPSFLSWRKNSPIRSPTTVQGIYIMTEKTRSFRKMAKDVTTPTREAEDTDSRISASSLSSTPSRSSGSNTWSTGVSPSSVPPMLTRLGARFADSQTSVANALPQNTQFSISNEEYLAASSRQNMGLNALAYQRQPSGQSPANLAQRPNNLRLISSSYANPNDTYPSSKNTGSTGTSPISRQESYKQAQANDASLHVLPENTGKQDPDVETLC